MSQPPNPEAPQPRYDNLVIARNTTGHISATFAGLTGLDAIAYHFQPNGILDRAGEMFVTASVATGMGT